MMAQAGEINETTLSYEGPHISIRKFKSGKQRGCQSGVVASRRVPVRPSNIIGLVIQEMATNISSHLQNWKVQVCCKESVIANKVLSLVVYCSRKLE